MRRRNRLEWFRCRGFEVGVVAQKVIRAEQGVEKIGAKRTAPGLIDCRGCVDKNSSSRNEADESKFAHPTQCRRAAVGGFVQ